MSPRARTLGGSAKAGMMVSAPTPDLAGFAAAQSYLRQTFGRDIRFYGQAAVIWDPSIPTTAFDDEGIPLDPLAAGTVVASAGVPLAGLTLLGSAHGNVVFRPLQSSIMRRDETYETPLGIRSGLNRDLILDPAAEPVTVGATHFMVGTLARDDGGSVVYPEGWTPEDGKLWEITNVQFDCFGSVERLIVNGEDTQ